MNSKNINVLVMMIILLSLLFISIQLYPIDKYTEKNENEPIPTIGSITFNNNTGYVFFISHEINYTLSETGKWYFNSKNKYLEKYIIITTIIFQCNKSLLTFNSSESKIENKIYFTYNITVGIYDRNLQNYTSFDLPLSFIKINIADLSYTILENNTIQSSTIIYSSYFYPYEFNSRSYRIIYDFFVSYTYFIDYMQPNKHYYFKSDTYILPFYFVLIYDVSSLIPKYIIYTIFCFGIITIYIGILTLYKKRKRIY